VVSVRSLPEPDRKASIRHNRPEEVMLISSRLLCAVAVLGLTLVSGADSWAEEKHPAVGSAPAAPAQQPVAEPPAQVGMPGCPMKGEGPCCAECQEARQADKPADCPCQRARKAQEGLKE
jgi:hypothetical protein